MNLACLEIPRAAKQDILFIHGNLASGAWWRPTVQEWERLGPLGQGSLLLTDLRGCGASPEWPSEQSFSLTDMAEDVLALLRAKGQGEVGLVGHSLGGLLALQLMILDPRRFSRAVLLDPVGPTGVAFDDSMYEAFRQMATNRALTGAVVLSTIRAQEHLAPELREQFTTDAFKAVRGVGHAILEVLKTMDLTTAVAKIKTPTLILHGRHDQIIPLHDSEKLARTMINAKLEVLEDAGHCWNLENPKNFTERLRAWF